MKIITNNRPRPLLGWWDLSDKEKAEFDWLETEEEQGSAGFFRYTGHTYCLGEFTVPNSPLFLYWDGVANDSFFSGVLIKHIHSLDDEIVVGRYYC